MPVHLLPRQNSCTGRYQFYTCSKGPFRGCCASDPCGTGKCPTEDYGGDGNGNSPEDEEPDSSSTPPSQEYERTSSRLVAILTITRTPTPASPRQTTITLSSSPSTPTASTTGSPSALESSLSTTPPSTPSITPSITPSATSSSETSSEASSSSSSSSNAPIIGGAVGGVIVLLIIAALAFFLWRRKRKNNREPIVVTPMPMSPAPSPAGPVEKDGTPAGPNTPSVGGEGFMSDGSKIAALKHQSTISDAQTLIGSPRDFKDGQSSYSNHSSPAIGPPAYHNRSGVTSMCTVDEDGLHPAQETSLLLPQSTELPASMPDRAAMTPELPGIGRSVARVELPVESYRELGNVADVPATPVKRTEGSLTPPEVTTSDGVVLRANLNMDDISRRNTPQPQPQEHVMSFMSFNEDSASDAKPSPKIT
ncbi:hypothetical protein AJ80_04916 [Polytolypa hystricis UAMH7299]|uniref:Epidermal growth factor receptor-like transmembrane-juxtamembrane segment domain-containing protein n=1 Tax=Polytolypa hystricis (strain UAMH7299) TaxID=1447883 RepID=A0A2B7Y9B4_POLH7|nr:hypothetical protein AJ80_04916 [Polytolypa hystricis UAMH7299]